MSGIRERTSIGVKPRKTGRRKVRAPVNVVASKDFFYYVVVGTDLVHRLNHDDIDRIPHFAKYLKTHPSANTTPAKAGTVQPLDVVEQGRTYRVHLLKHHVFIAKYVARWVRRVKLDKSSEEAYVPRELIKSPFITHILRFGDGEQLTEYLDRELPPATADDVSSITRKIYMQRLVTALLLTAEKLGMEILTDKLVAVQGACLRACAAAEFHEFEVNGPVDIPEQGLGAAYIGGDGAESEDGGADPIGGADVPIIVADDDDQLVGDADGGSIIVADADGSIIATDTSRSS